MTVLERSLARFAQGDMEGAAAALVRGLDAAPGAPAPASARLHARLGYVCRYAGWMERSIAAYRTAARLDPSPAMRIEAEAQVAKSLIYQGRLDEALACHARIDGWRAELGLGPDPKLLMYEGVARLYAGDRERAAARFAASLAADPGDLWARFGAAYRSAAAGDRRGVLEAARALERRDDVGDGERRYRLVHLCALGGDPARAAAHLEDVVAAGFFNHPYMARDPWLDALRGDPAACAALGAAEARHRRFGAVLGAA